MFLKQYKPTSIAFITTYKCTSSCDKCCFECNPDRNEFLPFTTMIKHIEYVNKNIPSIKLIVFTGGECFLIPEIYDLISYANENGYITRCVTNGFWADNKKLMYDTITKLVQAGLGEINFSTGNDHLKYVPFDQIASASIITAKKGIRTLISVGETAESNFTWKSALLNSKIKNYNNYNDNQIYIHKSKWIDLSSSSYANKKEKLLNFKSSGCHHILKNLAIDPNNNLFACCGITCNFIKELYLGNLDKNQLDCLIEGSLNDFLFFWISFEGPQKILKILSQKISISEDLLKCSNMCILCKILFNNPRIKNHLNKFWKNYFYEVLFRYYIKSKLKNIGGELYYGIKPTK